MGSRASRMPPNVEDSVLEMQKELNVQILSDVHLEMSDIPFEHIIPEVTAPLLILAGDIGVPLDSRKNEAEARTYKFLEWVNGLYKCVLYVPGNHEHYRYDWKGEEHFATELKRVLHPLENVHVLMSDTYRDESSNRIYIGTTMWSDISGASVRSWGMIGDSHNILGLSREDYSKLHVDSVNWLKGQLEEAAAHPDLEVIVITHHSPIPGNASIPARHHFSSASGEVNMTDFFRTDMSALFPRCRAWVFGHTHQKYAAVHDGCRCISNARGYAWQQQRPPA